MNAFPSYPCILSSSRNLDQENHHSSKTEQIQCNINCILLKLSKVEVRENSFPRVYKNLKDPILPSKKALIQSAIKSKVYNNFVNAWFTLKWLLRPLFRRPSFHPTCKYQYMKFLKVNKQGKN